MLLPIHGCIHQGLARCNAFVGLLLQEAPCHVRVSDGFIEVAKPGENQVLISHAGAELEDLTPLMLFRWSSPITTYSYWTLVGGQPFMGVVTAVLSRSTTPCREASPAMEVGSLVGASPSQRAHQGAANGNATSHFSPGSLLSECGDGTQGFCWPLRRTASVDWGPRRCREVEDHVLV